MAVNVPLDAELAQQLQRQADVFRVSLGDFAIQILQDAVHRPLGSGAWKYLNARRLDLIAVEYAQGLSQAEAEELGALQDAVAKSCVPEDHRLLKRLDEVEQRAIDSQSASDESVCAIGCRSSPELSASAFAT